MWAGEAVPASCRDQVVMGSTTPPAGTGARRHRSAVPLGYQLIAEYRTQRLGEAITCRTGAF
jgi:hypothetical protein